MVILFLLSANGGTILAAVVVWSAYGFWHAAILAPIAGCAAGALALRLAGGCRGQAGFHGSHQRDQTTSQVAALTDIVEASKKGGEQRPSRLGQPSAEQAA